MTVEVWADVACPFAHVGLTLLRRVRPDVDVRVRSWPLELVNEAPFDGAHLAPEIKAVRDGVAPELFTGFDAAGFPASTLPALAAERAAGTELSYVLRDALWERGLDVGDPAVLRSLGAPEGSVDAVLADFEEGKARGVQGSPHWFTSGGDFFCPSLDIRHEGDVWDVSFDRDGFERFLSSL